MVEFQKTLKKGKIKSVSVERFRISPKAKPGKGFVVVINDDELLGSRSKIKGIQGTVFFPTVFENKKVAMKVAKEIRKRKERMKKKRKTRKRPQAFAQAGFFGLGVGIRERTVR